MFVSPSPLAIQTTPARSSEAGVIVLSMDCRILHINARAVGFAHLFDEGPHRLRGPATRVLLSYPIMDLFYEVLANLEKHIAAEDWGQFEIIHVAHSVNGPVLLRGFGIPDQARRRQSRVILTLHHGPDPSPL
ncbi:MAG: hypothetical protein H0V35_05015 [Nitrospira sp.]|nr:hypothetical protein [Nitrospira sp.]